MFVKLLKFNFSQQCRYRTSPDFYCLKCILIQALPNGHDDIEGMRIIRDPETLVGKGIGYLLFKDRDCVLKALALHKV